MYQVFLLSETILPPTYNKSKTKVSGRWSSLEIPVEVHIKAMPDHT